MIIFIRSKFYPYSWLLVDRRRTQWSINDQFDGPSYSQHPPPQYRDWKKAVGRRSCRLLDTSILDTEPPKSCYRFWNIVSQQLVDEFISKEYHISRKGLPSSFSRGRQRGLSSKTILSEWNIHVQLLLFPTLHTCTVPPDLDAGWWLTTAREPARWSHLSGERERPRQRCPSSVPRPEGASFTPLALRG